MYGNFPFLLWPDIQNIKTDPTAYDKTVCVTSCPNQEYSMCMPNSKYSTCPKIYYNTTLCN